MFQVGRQAGKWHMSVSEAGRHGSVSCSLWFMVTSHPWAQSIIRASYLSITVVLHTPCGAWLIQVTITASPIGTERSQGSAGVCVAVGLCVLLGGTIEVSADRSIG